MGSFSSEFIGAGIGALGILALVMIVPALLAFGASVALYVLQSLGFYKIAKRRGIRHAWLSWVPLLYVWVLGSISDQYRYVVKGQYRSSRKVLPVLGGVTWVLNAVYGGLYLAAWVSILPKLPAMLSGTLDLAVLGTMLHNAMGGALWVNVAGILVGLAFWVVQLICLYDLFASCLPKWKLLLLILGIIFPVALPIFLFLCRNQDQGMPPRKEQVVSPGPEVTA